MQWTPFQFSELESISPKISSPMISSYQQHIVFSENMPIEISSNRSVIGTPHHHASVNQVEAIELEPFCDKTSETTAEVKED